MDMWVWACVWGENFRLEWCLETEKSKEQNNEEIKQYCKNWRGFCLIPINSAK